MTRTRHRNRHHIIAARSDVAINLIDLTGFAGMLKPKAVRHEMIRRDLPADDKHDSTSIPLHFTITAVPILSGRAELGSTALIHTRQKSRMMFFRF